jgi:phosphosulfolactate phosphohydrolase-like enzyme
VPAATLEVVLVWAATRPKAVARMVRVVNCMVDVVVCDEVSHVEGGFEEEDVLMKQVKSMGTI